MFENEIYDKIENRLYEKASVNKLPLRGNFELTPRCSLSCKMCYVVMTPEQIRLSGRKELSASQWLHLGEQACKSGMLFLLLTGGEALVRDDFKEIYSGLSAMGISLDLNSNGTLFYGDTMDFIAANPPSQVNLTLYGGSNETYRRLCGLPDGFDRVMRSIDNLLAAGINVKLQATLTPENYQDADKIIEIVNTLKLPSHIVSYTFPPKRRDGDAAVAERLDAATAARLDLKIKTKLWCGLPKEYFASALSVCESGRKAANPQPMEISCRAGRSSFWISWDGVMFPCCVMDNVRAYPLEVGFDRAWKETYTATEQIYFPEKCWSCDKKVLCPGCPALFYCETGDMNKCSDFICSFADNYVECAKEYVK